MPRDWTERHIIELIKKHGNSGGGGTPYVLRNPAPRVFELGPHLTDGSAILTPSTNTLLEMSDTARELLGNPKITETPTGSHYSNYVYEIGNVRVVAASNPWYTYNNETVNTVYGYGLPTPTIIEERYQEARAVVLNSYCGFWAGAEKGQDYMFSIPLIDNYPNHGNIEITLPNTFKECLAVIIPRSARYKLFNDASDVFTLIQHSYYHTTYMVNSDIISNGPVLIETLHIYTPGATTKNVWYLLVNGSVRGVVTGL